MKKNIIRRSDNLLSLPSASSSVETLLEILFQHRGASKQQADYALRNLLPPVNMKGVDAAVEILEQALLEQKKILIVGDFDADGATSSTLAVACLRAFGCKSVDFLVPNRFEYGYGLTPEIVEVAKQYSPEVLVTVDNGISSIEGVKAANANNIEVVVTDHHLPGNELPPAAAIVNPNQPGCTFPSKNLAGVGVIFYVLSALRSVLRENDWFRLQNIPEPSMGNFLDLVALGTVADVVPLDHNNRVLVAAGLKKMRMGQAIPGIRAILQVAGRDPKNISASDLGFAVGPRLNAAGRLDDMSLGIRCLLSENYAEALSLASELDSLNKERRAIETSMQFEAKQILQKFMQETEIGDRAGLCLYKDDWHQGVIGILASRIKDAMHRPTIIFAESDERELKGSGRSINGVHLRDVLDEVATQNPGLITKFGGHAMAAGLSIDKNKLSQFSDAFDACVAKHLLPENLEPVVLSDGELPSHFINLNIAQQLREAGPWGQHFPEPTFDGEFELVQQRIVGEKHLKMRVQLNGRESFDAIAFNVDVASWPDTSIKKVKLAYKLDVNEFRGEQSAQLLVDYIEKIMD
ncbi:Single-stranded-DNA-specific exonuclease RecJ [Thalassocella blandensis]|nr:Single-stranded-DNA-specific exonuclease RecJ [Thalassocella blandensis]